MSQSQNTSCSELSCVQLLHKWHIHHSDKWTMQCNFTASFSCVHAHTFYIYANTLHTPTHIIQTFTHITHTLRYTTCTHAYITTHTRIFYTHTHARFTLIHIIHTRTHIQTGDQCSSSLYTCTCTHIVHTRTHKLLTITHQMQQPGWYRCNQLYAAVDDKWWSAHTYTHTLTTHTHTTRATAIKFVNHICLELVQ